MAGAQLHIVMRLPQYQAGNVNFVIIPRLPFVAREHKIFLDFFTAETPFMDPVWARSSLVGQGSRSNLRTGGNNQRL